MVWSERQARMLEAMGIRVWQAPAAAPEATLPEAASDPPEAAVAGAPAREAVAPGVTAPPRPVVARAPAPSMLRPAPPPTGSTVAESEAASAMDWPALRDTVAGCTACGLCAGRTRTVFGTGNPRAHWMVVGEAPGEPEDREGEPFVGKSGQLLDNMLQALGLTRHDGGPPERQVYLTNAVKCRPPDNRNPEPAELARCEPYLMRQIALVQPRVILAMGRFAVQSLLRSNEPIGRLRGRVHTYEQVPLVVTYHPTYLLRNPEDKGRAWDDLCLAREAIEAGA